MRVASPPAGDGSILGVTPRAVLAPASVDEAAELMRGLARDRATVAFVGGGTDLDLGAPPRSLDAVVRTERLARILEYAPSDQVVVAEAGMTLAALQRALAEHRQRLALDPPLPERATLGGILTANAFGPSRARHGSIRDLVIGITIIRADGAVAKGGGKVVKNVAGFDLSRLMVGSLGTLGLVAAVAFRLHPLPEAAATLLLPDVGAAALWTAAKLLRDAQLEPAAAAALGRHGRFRLGVRFEGFEVGVAAQARKAAELASGAGLGAELLDEAGARTFWAEHDAARVSGVLRAKLAALPASVEGVASAAVEPLLASLEEAQAIWYPTLGLGFVTGTPSTAKRVAQAAETARTVLRASGGSLTITAAPPDVRAAVDVWGPPPPFFLLMRRLKDRLDPDHRLAPGRFVGGL